MSSIVVWFLLLKLSYLPPLGDILRKTVVTFVSLSCIVQTLWDLCECQVIIEATVPFNIKMDAN